MKPTSGRGAARTALLGGVCLVLAAACGQPAGGNGGANDGGTGEATDAGAQKETRTLIGKIEVIFWAPDGTSTRAPADTTRTFVEAHVPNAQGGWDKFAGLASANGTYSISGLPLTGDYWLRVYEGDQRVDTYVWTNGDAPDLSRDARGRAEQPISHDRKTALTFHVDGLDAWQDNDELEMSAPSAGLSRVAVPTFYATNPPVAGDTKLDGLQLAWGGLPLLSEANHDALQLVQLRASMDPTNTFSFMSPVKTAMLSNLTLVEGVENSATGVFTDAPAFNYALEWKRTAFAALATHVHPDRASPPSFYSFFVHAIPGGADHGRIQPYELRVIDNAFLPSDGADMSVTLAAHNPYPESWLINGFNASFPVSLTLAEGGLDTEVEGEIGYVSTELPNAAHPAVPLISPVRNLKLGDKAIAQRTDGVGADPELSWTPPEIGTPTSYEVHLQRALVTREQGPGGRPQVHIDLSDTAVLLVPGDVTKVKLPPELLQDGVSYLIRVRAIHQEGQDVRHAPFKQSLPFGWADAWSAFFTR